MNNEKIVKKHFFIHNLLAFVIPLIIPLVIMGVGLIVVIDNVTTKQVEESLKTDAELLKMNIDSPFRDIDGFLMNFHSNPSIVNFINTILDNQSYSLDEIRTFNMMQSTINSFINSRGYFHSIYMWGDSSYGKFISSLNGIVYSDDYWDSGWIEYVGEMEKWDSYYEIRKIKQAFSDPGGIKVISIFRRNENPGGIVFNVNYSYFDELIISLFPPSEGYFILITDETGDIIYPEEGVLETTDFQNISEDVSRIEVENTKYFAIKKNSDFNGWRYFLFLSESYSMVIPRIVRIVITIIMVVAIFVVICIAMHITKKNNRLLNDIVDILNNGDEATDWTMKKNSYESIIRNVLQVFLEKKYLQDHMSSMEFRALQYQINPHFLYNTLNAIYWESIRLGRGKNKASDMIESLSSILEYSLANPLDAVPLEDEINYAKNYLLIQTYRFPGKFNVVWNIDESTLDQKTLKLILQPLLENCISHGFKEITGKGMIWITFIRKESVVEIIVEDNGCGMDSEVREKIINDMDFSDSSIHIGLVNTYKRLKLFYGGNVVFNIQSTKGIGTKIIISIPFI